MVSLSKELSAMVDYTELQKLRAGRNADISIVIPGETGNWLVAPLLFLPLIENCFKHGIKGSAGPVFAKMIFSIPGDRLEAYFENNIEITADEGARTAHGIGLVNLRDRLELLYPGSHELKIITDNERFIVKLNIPLNERSPLPGH